MNSLNQQPLWLQNSIELTPKKRGFHLVTDEILAKLPEIHQYSIGIAHFLLLHTSASLTLNENADPDVRDDFETFFSQAVPDYGNSFKHLLEGPDDMPAHIKSSILGVTLTVPVRSGRLALGTWQGIYLGEHRNAAGARRIVVTLQGLIETTS